MIRRILFVLVLGHVTPLGAQAHTARGTPLDGIRRLVQRRAVADSFSGTVLLAHCDSVLLEIYAGLADRAESRRVGPRTRFRVASMTKMLTGVAVMQLAEGGRLAPSDTISRLVPALPPSPFNRITVHQLLTHTSGLGSIWTPTFFAKGPAAFRTTADYLPLFVREPLLFEPGTRWAYSNAGYVLLGLAIEQASGERYVDYVRRHIYAPAGVSDDRADEIERVDPDRAVAYTRGGDGRSRWRSAEHMGLRRMMPAGGAVLSARDLHRLALALLRHQLLDSVATESIMAGRVEYRAGARYGYGFANELVGGRRVVFHDGGADGVSANLDLMPERGLIAIVLANMDPPASRPIRDALRTAMLSLRRSNASCR